MLLFFAVSGAWQMYGLHRGHSRMLAMLSTIHTSQSLKIGGSLANPVLRDFELVMALSFVVTTLLGVVMALKFGKNRRLACGCLAFGVLFPVIVVLAGVHA